MRATILLLPLCAVLSACAAHADYPSLALRDAERNNGVRTPSTAGLALVDPAPPSPEVRARIAQAVEEAQAAHGRFRAAAPATRRAVAAGGRAAIDSEAYAAAQIALGNLQSIASEATFALADLDRMLAERSNALLSTGEVEAARATVAALVEEERAVLASLERSIR